MMFKHVFSVLTGIVLAASGLTASTVARAQDKQLNVMIWGVTWQSAVAAASEEFTKKTGVKVNFVTQASSNEGLVKLQAMKASPTVDVWFTTASVAERAVTDAQLFAPLPVAKMPNLAKLPPGTATEKYVGIYSYPISIIYRTDLVDGPITSWNDLWQPRFARKIAVPALNMYQARMLMIASHLNGGNANDTDKGFEMLARLKPNVAMFYSSDAQARQALAQGEVSVLIAPPSQGKRVADAGRPVKVISPKPAPLNHDVATIVRTGREAIAAEYIDFLLSKQVNETLAAKLNMAAVNVDAQQPPALLEQLPKRGDELILDEAAINRNIGAWIERFNRDIAR